MTHKPQIKIPATYMRGGTSKGVFFRLQDLPPEAQVPGPARDALLLRVIGSPDPYGKQIDGMGVLPLEFQPGTNRLSLGIDGTETFDVIGERTPRATLTLVIHRRDGSQLKVPVTCRLDTAEEVSIYEAGGVLQRFAQDFLAATVAPTTGNAIGNTTTTGAA